MAIGLHKMLTRGIFSMEPCGHRGCLAACDFSPVGVEWRYHGILPQSGHTGLSIAFWCPIVVGVWDLACCPRLVAPGWVAGHLVDSNFSVSPPLRSTGHMAINADLLVPGK